MKIAAIVTSLFLTIVATSVACGEEPQRIPTAGHSDNFAACVDAYEKIGNEFMRCNYPRPETDAEIISVCEQYDNEELDCTAALNDWATAHECNGGSLTVNENVMTCQTVGSDDSVVQDS